MAFDLQNFPVSGGKSVLRVGQVNIVLVVLDKRLSMLLYLQLSAEESLCKNISE